MARCIVYKRSLDVKVLPSSGNSNHEFQFSNSLEIKKEVDTESLNMESGLTPGATVTNSSGPHDDHDSELDSVNTSVQLLQGNDAAHPKLVIKFRDLWKKSEQSIDFPQKRKESEDRESVNKTLTVHKLRSNRMSELSTSLGDCVTQSSSLTPKPSDSNQETKGTSNCLQPEPVSDKKEKRNVRKFGQLKNNKNTSCESCGLHFTTLRKLQSHQRYWNPSGEFRCTICDQNFSRNFQLARHVKVVHFATPAIKQKYTFKCHFCNNRFEKNTHLIAHMVHLHNKHVVSKKKSTNGNGELVSHTNAGARKKTRASIRKSKHVHYSNSGATTLDGDSGLIEDPRGSVGNLRDANEHLIDKNSRVQQNKPPASQLTGDNMDFENEEANTNSKRDPNDTDHLKQKRIVMNMEKSNVEGTTTLHGIQYSINDSTEKSIASRDVKKTFDNAVPSSRKELSTMNTGAPILQQSKGKRSQTQRWIQTGVKILPKNIQPQQMGNLIDHLGNAVGTWRTTQPYEQPDKQVYISDSSSASTPADLGVADMLRCTRSGILKPTILSSSILNIMDTVSSSDRKLAQDEDSSFQGKSMNVMEKNNFANERLKVLTQHEKSVKQVGSVQSHQALEVLKSAGRNVDGEDAAIECNDFDINLIQVDDFGETSVKIEDEEMSSDGCEPISFEIAASSSNISLTDSSSPKSDRVTTLNSCNTPNDPKIKDVRVLLVKLENMSNVSTKTCPPESSPLDNYSLVKAETPYCNPREEQSTSDLALRHYPKRKHDSQVVNPEGDSGSIIIKNRDTTNNVRKVISKKNGLHGVRKSGQKSTKQSKVTKKQCHLCDKVFHHVLSSASHYFSVHTEVGALKCCVCGVSFKNVTKLRFHLYGHYSDTPERKLRKFCVVCKKELSIPSSSLCCSNCNENSNAKQGEEEGIEQVPNVKDSIKRDHTQVIEKVNVSANGSLSEVSSVSMSKKKEKSNTSVVDHESAKNDKKVIFSVTCKEVVKNFTCSICNCAFFKGSQLQHHLLVAHTDMKYRKSKRYQSTFGKQTLSYSTSRDSKRERTKRSKNKNNLPNFNAGEKKYFASKGARIHDKFCKKKSYERRRLKFFEKNSRSEHFIRQHNTRGNAKTRYEHKCDVCGLKCCCRKNLEIHKKRYSKNGKNACNICGLTFGWKHLLATHMKTAHNQKILFPSRLRCEICNQGFHNKKLLRIHLAHFHNLKYFQCTICRIRFGTSRGLNNHRRYYSRNRSNVCGICSQSLKCKYMLQYHKAQVHDRRNLKAYKYLCKVCDCAFIDELLLQAHVGHFHNIQAREAEKNVINKDDSIITEQVSENIELPATTDIVCNDSNVATNDSTIQKDVIAADYDQTTSDVVVVGEIIRTHTSSRYKCDICKLSFNDPYAMLNHEWDYSNEGTFTCNVCNRKFMTYFLLKNHKIKHFQRNVIRNYECDICKEDFSRADHLNVHGLHLHGPQFVLVKGSGTDDILDNSMSESGIDSDRDSVLKESSVDDGYELVAGYHKTIPCGKFLMFRKFGNNRSPTELSRRNSNEDAYSCCFCQMSFSSSILLRSHIKKHDYRPYYNNTSRYLCLICKDKFRTNDLLRAHVVHAHTSDPQEQNLSESKESRRHSSNIQSGVSKNINTTERVSENSAKHAVQNLTFNSVIVESDYPEIISHIEFNSTPEEVRLFTVKVENVEGSQKHMCTICIVTFDSVAQFIEHFASTHVKNGAYLCTFCGEKFSLMADLKGHTFKHENESKKYVCCDEKFLLVTDFVRHQSSHDGRTEEEQDESNAQLSPLVESAGGSEFGHESNPDDPCKCEICGKILLNFQAMLKHWDSCIDKNGLQCDLCKATFKSLTSFREHQTTHHKGKLDVNYIKNRRRPRVISDQIIQVSMQNSIMHGNNPRTINKSLSVNARKKLGRAVASTGKLPKQNELLKFGNVTVNPLAQEVKNFKNNNEFHVNEHQENNGTGPRPEFTPNQNVRLPEPGRVLKKSPRMISIERFNEKIHWKKQDDSNTPVSALPQPVNSSTQGRRLDKEVSNDIPSNANENCSLYHLPVQGVNNISRVHVRSNDSSLRLQQNERQEQKLTRSQAIPSNTVNDLSSIPSTARTSINIDNMRVASSEFGDKLRSNDCGRQEPLNLIPASVNAADNAALLICIQPTANHSNNINNAMILPSDSGHTVQPNDSSSKLLPSLQPFSLNVGPSPAYFLCLTPVSENSSKCITQAVPLNDSNITYQPNNQTGKKLPTILRKSPNLVPNPIHDPNVLRKAVPSNRKNKQYVVPHDFTSQTRLTSNKAIGAPKLLPAPSTSTSGNLPKPEKMVTKGRDIPTDQSASNEEPVPKKRIVRCSYCNLIFTEEAKLIQHMESHKRNNQCPACGLIFSNEKALQLHLPEHKSSTCTKCNMIAFFSDSLVRPKGAERYCTACDTRLPLPTRRNNRFARTTTHQVMKCGICMDTFRTMSQMTLHFKKFHSAFVCGTCESRFSTKESLYSHLRTHGSANPSLFQCKTCMKYFLDGIDLAAHSLSH